MSRGVKNQLAKRLQQDTAYNVSNKILQEFAVKMLEQDHYKIILYSFKKYMEEQNANTTQKLPKLLLPKKDTKNKRTPLPNTRNKDKIDVHLQSIPIFIKKSSSPKKLK